MTILATLYSGSLHLEIELIKQLLTKNNLLDTPVQYYRWRGHVICRTNFRILKDKSHNTFFAIPKELDSMMYKIIKHHKRWFNSRNLIKQINNFTYYMGEIDEDVWPTLIKDYYLNSFISSTHDTERHERDLTKVVIILDQLEPNLNWLHENNVLMQTL